MDTLRNPILTYGVKNVKFSQRQGSLYCSTNLRQYGCQPDTKYAARPSLWRICWCAWLPLNFQVVLLDVSKLSSCQCKLVLVHQAQKMRIIMKSIFTTAAEVLFFMDTLRNSIVTYGVKNVNFIQRQGGLYCSTNLRQHGCQPDTKYAARPSLWRICWCAWLPLNLQVVLLDDSKLSSSNKFLYTLLAHKTNIKSLQ